MAEDKKTTTPEAGVVVNKEKDNSNTGNSTVGKSQENTTGQDNKPTPTTTKEANPFKVEAKVKKRIEAVFKQKPSCEKLYVTFDYTIFDDKAYAKAHAKKLDQKEIYVAVRN